MWPQIWGILDFGFGGFWILDLGISDFGFWILGILDFGDFGFWGFWILGILDFGFLDRYVANLYVMPPTPQIWGILDFGDFGFWGFWILEFGDFGFWILDFVTNFGCYIRKEDCARRTGSADFQYTYTLYLICTMMQSIIRMWFTDGFHAGFTILPSKLSPQ